jgi:hypothetical protein
VGPTYQRLTPLSGVTLRARGASWAWAVSWPGPVGSPAALFYIIFLKRDFLFPVLKQICFIFVIKLAQFETLQICKIL